MYNFSETFIAFKNEAVFTNELLSIGVTQLYKANYSRKGVYFQSFVCLSTGIERLEKLCIILAHCISNQGVLPTEKEIKAYGHNIKHLFDVCKKEAEKNNISFEFSCNIDDEIYTKIIEILNEFASSKGRYANINEITGSNIDRIDCVKRWYNEIDMQLYKNNVTDYKKNKIEANATIIGDVLNQFSNVMYLNENRECVQDAILASRMTGIWEAVAPYRQLYVLQIIRYLTELIMGLGYLCMKIRPNDIPHFGEIFGLFYNSDTYFKSRKTWDNL